MPRPKLLILGGTPEGAALAKSINQNRWDVCISYAGVTGHQPELPVPIHVGGFGGTEGLIAFIKDNGYTHLIDATHPYADVISEHACEAAAVTKIKAIRIERAEWLEKPGDDWIRVANMEAAAQEVSKRKVKTLLTTGTKDLAVFEKLSHIEFVVRLFDQPQKPLNFANAQTIIAKPPFCARDETEQFMLLGIKLMVTKNSGGGQTYSKLEVARKLGFPVIMVERPKPSALDSFTNFNEIRAWLDREA